MKRIQSSPETFESRLQQVRWHVRILYVLTSLCIASIVANFLLLRSTFNLKPDDVTIDVSHGRYKHLQALEKVQAPPDDGERSARSRRRAVWVDDSDDVLRQRYPLPFLDEPRQEEEGEARHNPEGSGSEAGSGVWLTSYLKVPVCFTNTYQY